MTAAGDFYEGRRDEVSTHPPVTLLRHAAEGGPVNQERPRDETDSRLTSRPPEAHQRGRRGGAGGDLRDEHSLTKYLILT